MKEETVNQEVKGEQEVQWSGNTQHFWLFFCYYISLFRAV
jgi:hypothetical protein